MERGTGDRTILDQFVIDFASIVEKYAKYIVVSGFVALAHGRSRATEDIDMIIERLDIQHFSKLHQSLVKSGFECIQSDNPEEIFDEYLKNNTSIRYVKKGTFVPEMEIKFSKDELDDYQIKTRKKLELTGLDIYFSSIEMNIAFKEELLKSEKDIKDAAHLRIVYSGKLNNTEIEKIKQLIRKFRLNGEKNEK